MADPSPLVEAIDHCDPVTSCHRGDWVVGQGAGPSAFAGRCTPGLRRPNRFGWKRWRRLAAPSSCSPARAAARPCCCPARIACCATRRPPRFSGRSRASTSRRPTLRAWIAGCPEATGQARNLRSYGADWAAADSESGRTLWIRRVPVVAGGRPSAGGSSPSTPGPLTVEFAEHTGERSRARLRIRRAAIGRCRRPRRAARSAPGGARGRSGRRGVCHRRARRRRADHDRGVAGVRAPPGPHDATSRLRAFVPS